MMSRKTIYLHIGMPKTGTSSIQLFLYNNRERLEENGFLYPVVYPFSGEAPVEGGNVTRLFYNITDRLRLRTSLEIVEEFNTRFMPVISDSKADKIILSSEGVFLCPFKYFEKFFKLDFDFKIIVYVRRPAELLISGYSQTIKQCVNQPNFDKFIDQFVIHYEFIEEYINNFGKENVIIRPYEKEQWEGGNLVRDFLKCIGADYNNEEVFTKVINKSLSRNKTEILRLKNALGMDIFSSVKCANELIAAKENDEYPKIIETVTDEKIKISTERWIPIVDKIAQIYGKEKLFINDYPECYGKARPKFDRISFSVEEFEILHKIITEVTEKRKAEIEDLKSKLNRSKFFTSWEHGSHKVYKIGGFRFKFKK